MTRTDTRLRAAFVAALGVVPSPAPAFADQTGANCRPAAAAGSRVVSAPERTALIESILARIEHGYVLPAMAQTVGATIRKRLQEGDYEAIGRADTLASTLTSQLQDITHDKHLAVVYSPTVLPEMAAATWGDIPASERAARDDWMRQRNYGFRRVEVLDGNVGYLDLIGMAPCESAWDTAVSAMRFLAETDALIIDLCDNRGGSPEMVSMLCSYLLQDGFKAVHINDVYSRADGETHQFWTLPYVPGKRYAGKDVYVLTSSRTLSSAEELAYDLQALRRATIVGETTVGGAHIGATERLSDHFALFLPSGRSVNPVTGTNWEGVGVLPDVAATRELALPVAHLAALRGLAAKASTEAGKERLAEAIAAADQLLNARKRSGCR